MSQKPLSIQIIDYFVLEMTISGSKSRFSFITFIDLNEIVGQTNVYLWIVLSSSELIKHFRKEKKKVSVLDCNRVQNPIVDTKFQRPLFVLDKGNKCSS